MSVSGVGGIDVNGLSYAGALTPDAMLAYCSSRLKDIDDQVQTAFAKQNSYRSETEALNGLQEKLGALGASPYDGIHADDTDNRGQVEKLFQDALSATPDGTDAKAQLQSAYNDYEASMDPAKGGDNILGKDEAASFATRIGTISKDVSSSAELDMVALQSLMSQRTTAIQTATNLVQAQGQEATYQSQNIGK